jgi:hypothetical protein
MRFELQLAQQIRRHEVQQVRTGRDTESRREFAGHRRATDLGSGLEQQHRAAAARQCRRAYQAIVPAADDHAVVARRR